MTTFQVVGRSGVLESDTPKLDALKYTAWLNLAGIGYSMIAEDGRYTVAGDGCQTLVFVGRSTEPQRRTAAGQTVARYGEG